MRVATFVLLSVFLLAGASVRAEPAGELRGAITTLSRASYAWETSTRQRFRGETAEPRLNANAPTEVQGRFDPNGFIQITTPTSATQPVPVTAVFRQGDVVLHTPRGWLRRTEIRETAPGDRPVEWQGKQVRTSRVFTAALRLAGMRPPSEELLDLLGDMKSCRVENGLFLVELRDAAIEQLWGDSQAKRAPEIQGTVIVKLNEQDVAEYHYLLAIGFPNSRTKTIAWSMQQWSTRLSGIGTTTVEPPEDAVKALEK